MRPGAPRLILAQRLLTAVVALFLAFLGVGALVGALSFGLEQGAEVLGALLVTDAVVLAVAVALAARGRWPVDVIAVLALLGNALASVTDDVGPADVATLLTCITAAGLTAVNAVAIITARRRSSLPPGTGPRRSWSGDHGPA